MLKTHFTVSVLCIVLGLSMSMSVQGQQETKDDYSKRRSDFIQEEIRLRPGSQWNLTAMEKKANEVLMSMKQDEIQLARQGSGSPFLPSLHFFHAKASMEKSNVFKIIRTMPKGAVLHVHDSAMVDTMWLVKKATYLPNCYMCYQNDQLLFHFYHKAPPLTEGCEWQSVSYLRNKSSNVEEFDERLYHNMTVVTKDPHTAYPSQAAVWKRFQSIFTTTGGLIYYAPVFKAYMQRALQDFYDDNVLYIEIRALLLPVYELDGTEHDREWVLEVLREISQSFQKEHPDFMGIKIIFVSSRSGEKASIAADIAVAMELHSKYPDFMVGYDLVGQEDAGHSLLYFTEQLLTPSQREPPYKLPYFFHAGETNWNLEDVDDNLIDAVLLNTSRIGHGFALPKHPKVMEYITKKGIAVEVNPISNQVLLLVQDLRNHPASALLAAGVPVVVSSDDPGLWGATGVSYDWYELFMGIAGAKDDLGLLKTLAMDSIRYSAMSDSEKTKAMTIWDEKWKEFVHRASLH